jgi:hypothetical protein
MFIEERDYRIKAGKLATFLEAYETLGLPIQVHYLGPMIGYFTTEIGELNHVVSLWAYDSLDERSRRRDAMFEDAGWQHYLQATTDLIDTQTSRILKPSSFSPLR